VWPARAKDSAYALVCSKRAVFESMEAIAREGGTGEARGDEEQFAARDLAEVDGEQADSDGTLCAFRHSIGRTSDGSSADLAPAPPPSHRPRLLVLARFAPPPTSMTQAMLVR
jgi:hypothetical protein